MNYENKFDWLSRQLTRSSSLCSNTTFTEENEIKMDIDHFSRQPDSDTSSVTSFTFVNEEGKVSNQNNVSSETNARNMLNAATSQSKDDSRYQSQHASKDQNITAETKNFDRVTSKDNSVGQTSYGNKKLPFKTTMQSMFQHFETTNYTLVLTIHYSL